MENQRQRTLFRRAYEKLTVTNAKKALAAATFAAAFGGCGRDALLTLQKSGGSEPGQQSDAGFVAKDAQPQVSVDAQLPLDSTMPIADAQPKQDTSPAFARDTAVAKDTGSAAVPDGGIEVLGPDAMPDIIPTPGPDTMPACVPGTQPTQQPDSGALADGDPKAAPVLFVYSFNTLIGDNIDRTLLDRGTGPSTYPMGSDTDVNANPFTDGTSAGNLGPSDTALFKIDATMFPPFATAAITDNDAAKSYQAQQAVWISGNTHYSDAAAAVVGTLNSVSYTVKLSGANDDFGIPVCTTPTNTTNYMVCDPSYQTATHKVTIPFLGANWVITEMTPPSTPLTSETLLASGGSVKLAQEAAGGTINVVGTGPGPTYLTAGNLRFTLVSVDPSGGTAVLSVLDTATCKDLGKITLQAGTTTYFTDTDDGVTDPLHIWKISPGYTLGASWADMSIFWREMTLTSGQALDNDNSTNPYLTVYLGWTNKGASTIDTNPDHLRMIGLYAASGDISKLSSGGSSDLNTGDYVPIPQNPVSMQLQYKGLASTPASQTPLTFTLERDSNLSVSVQSGANSQTCTISAPYVHVASGGSGSIFTVDGMQGANGTASVSGNEFYVATGGASCNGSTGQLMAGALFMPSSGSMSYLDYASYAKSGQVIVNYPLAGATLPGMSSGPGTISYQNVDVGNMLPAGVDFVFSVGEDAGVLETRADILTVRPQAERDELDLQLRPADVQRGLLVQAGHHHILRSRTSHGAEQRKLAVRLHATVQRGHVQEAGVHKRPRLHVPRYRGNESPARHREPADLRAVRAGEEVALIFSSSISGTLPFPAVSAARNSRIWSTLSSHLCCSRASRSSRPWRNTPWPPRA